MNFYPAMVGLDLEDNEFPALFLGGNYDAPMRGHTPSELVKLAGNPPGLNQPHELVLYKFIPDEDYRIICDCDSWAIVTSSKKMEKHVRLWWGRDNQFSAPFILCREKGGDLLGWDNLGTCQQILEFMLGRQSYWKLRAEMRAEDQPLHDTLDDLIRSLKQ